jgi:hypothetical protein
MQPGLYEPWSVEPTPIETPSGEMFVGTTPNPVSVELRASEQESVEFGFAVVQPGIVRLSIFTDLDGDAVRDPVEPAESRVAACFHASQDPDIRISYPPCTSVGDDGTSSTLLPPGEHTLAVHPHVSDCFSCPSVTLDLSVQSGQTIQIEVPVDFTDFWNELYGS